MGMNRPSPDDAKDITMAEEIKRLRKENKKLKKLLNLSFDEQLLIETNERIMERNRELREEKNFKLKEKLEEVAKELIQHHEEYKNIADIVVKQKEQIEELEEEKENLIRADKKKTEHIEELEKENKELKKKLDILYHQV